jgi:REP element-mobilizing transposase RayT
MGRNLTLSVGEYYHVYRRGTEKRKIFIDKGDKERFVKLLYIANSTTSVHLSNFSGVSFEDIPKGDSIVDIGSWCMMSNHFHLLLKEKVDGGISTFMKKLLTGYSMYFNKKYFRKGVLFEGRFSAKHLDYDQYLKYQFAYIHLNPIAIVDSGWKKKEIVDVGKAKEFLSTYKYSSYLDYLGEERQEGKIINKKEFPDYFENTIDFSEMMNEWINFTD